LEDRKPKKKKKNLTEIWNKKIHQCQIPMVFVSFHAVDRRRIGLLPKLITLGNRPESVKEDDSDWGFLDDLKQEYR